MKSITMTERTASNTPAFDYRKIFGLREMGVYYALVLLVLILVVTTSYMGRPSYLSPVNITNIFYQSSLTAIMAVAMTVVLISGNFDLSVASVAALAGAIMIGFADQLGFGWAVGLGMGAAVSVGLVNGLIVQYLRINAFIVTLGTMTAVRGLVLLFTDGRSLSVSNPDVIAAMKVFETGRVSLMIPLITLAVVLVAGGGLLAILASRNKQSANLKSIGLVAGGLALALLGYLVGPQFAVPNPVIYMAVFVIIVWLTLTYTTVGRRLYAVGGNPEAARLAGINVNRYKTVAFIFCSAAAGFAGILFASRLRSINPAGLEGAELTVIAAAILGGTSLFGGAGSVIKTLAGALLLFTLTNGFNILNMGANYQGLIEGVVVVASAAIYTVGGKKRRPAG